MFGANDLDSAVGLEVKQVFIPGDNICSFGLDSAGQDHIIVRVTDYGPDLWQTGNQVRNNSQQPGVFNDCFIRVMVTFADARVLNEDTLSFIEDFIGQAQSKSSSLGHPQEIR